MAKLTKSIYHSIKYRSTNNILINNLLTFLKLDSILKPSQKIWNKFSFDIQKDLQENAGFSHREDVSEAILKAHNDLKETVATYLNKGDSILDIGCGPGLYLADFKENHKLFGSDISQGMINEAKKLVPDATFYKNDFLTQHFSNRFNLIYSISSMEYVPRSSITAYFKKIFELLEPKGILFIHYPHALSFYDTLIPNINYINYSPKVIEKTCKRYFTIIKHSHAYDERSIGRFDKKRYIGINGSFKNGCLLIAQKT
jgi:SAM-dependent methyltransferase